MKKFNLLVCSLLWGLGCTASYAGDLYVGLSLGSESNSIAKSGSAFMYDQNHQPIKASIKTVGGTDSAGGAAGELDLGYRQIISSRFSFGIEANAMTGSGQSKEKYLDPNSNVWNAAVQTLRFSVGASVLPSLRVYPHADVFLRAGMGVGQFKMQSNGFMYQMANYRTAVKDDFYSIFGLGVDGHFEKHWDFRLEADYMIFSAFDVINDNFDDTVPNPSGGAPSQQTVYQYNAKYSPSVVRVAVGMAYRF